MLSQSSENTATWKARVFAAVAFGLVSFVIVFTNKVVLCDTKNRRKNSNSIWPCYEFPSVKFLAFVQCCASCFVMLGQKFVLPRFTGSASGLNIPAPSWNVIKQIMPLPVFFFCNMITGLSATKKLNITMFVLLRRFSIPMTMLLEFYLLRHSSTNIIITSVAAMIVGALVAASDDITVDTSSVTSILLNDLFTALQGVVLKLKMNEAAASEKRTAAAAAEQQQADDGISGNNSGSSSSSNNKENAAESAAPPLTSDGILFYNSLLASGPAFLWWVSNPAEVSGVVGYHSWHRPGFLFWFLASMFLGFVLNYTYFLCTKLNSALTSTVVGVAKNTVSTFVGMGMGDYHFTPLNFTGVCISVFAALLYSFGEVQKSLRGKQIVAASTAMTTESAATAAPPPPKIVSVSTSGGAEEEGREKAT